MQRPRAVLQFVLWEFAALIVLLALTAAFGLKSPSENNSIEMDRLSMTRRSILRRNDANRAIPSAFIGAQRRFHSPWWPWGKRKISTADERR